MAKFRMLTKRDVARQSKSEQSCTLLGEMLDSFDQGLMLLFFFFSLHL